MPEMGGRYGHATSDLPDALYAAQLAAYNPALDQERLRDLLARLSRRNVSERELLQTAAEVAEWTQGQ